MQAPGLFGFLCCTTCGSLHIQPMPSSETLRLAYGGDYMTHAAVDAPYESRSYKALLIESILATAYGYDSEANVPRLWKFIGKIASLSRVMRSKAGVHVRFLPYRKNGTLLDVGCGNGQFLMAAIRRGWNACGLEPDPLAAAQAKSNRCAVIEGTIEDFDPHQDKYDAITMDHVLEHLPNPRVALDKLKNALTEDGVLVTVTPNPAGLVSRAFGASWYGLDPPRHLHIPTAVGLARLCGKIGLASTQFTLERNSYWYARESLSIRKCGRAYQSEARWIASLFRVMNVLGELMQLHVGEEIVCIARRAQGKD